MNWEAIGPGRVLAAALLLGASTASAHGLWITVNAPYASHGARHVVALLGFGHSHPVDDLLALPGDALQLAFYDLIAPDGQRRSLGMPDMRYVEPAGTAGGLQLQAGDLGVRKLIVPPDARSGTYQLVAESRPFVTTRYRDGSGTVRSAMRGIDEIEDAAEILFSVRFQTSAKAYYRLESATAPAPVGLELEIMPLSDVSRVRAGDLVEFQVLLRGEAITTDADFEHVMQASSSAFGLWDGMTLRSAIYGHKARFRFPAPGQWHLFADVRELVADSPGLAQYRGKVRAVYHSSSLTLDVLP